MLGLYERHEVGRLEIARLLDHPADPLFELRRALERANGFRAIPLPEADEPSGIANVASDADCGDAGLVADPRRKLCPGGDERPFVGRVDFPPAVREHLVHLSSLSSSRPLLQLRREA